MFKAFNNLAFMIMFSFYLSNYKLSLLENKKFKLDFENKIKSNPKVWDIRRKLMLVGEFNL